MPWTPVLMNPETEDRWQDDPAFAAKVYAARAAQAAAHAYLWWKKEVAG